jgi:hypothetical protein
MRSMLSEHNLYFVSIPINNPQFADRVKSETSRARVFVRKFEVNSIPIFCLNGPSRAYFRHSHSSHETGYCKPHQLRASARSPAAKNSPPALPSNSEPYSKL